MFIITKFILFFNYFCMAFTILLSLVYLAQLIVSFFKIKNDNKFKRSADYDKYGDSDNLLPISILIPAYNEQENIVHNIKSLLNINYPEFELIVVNDGSTDNTHFNVIESFGLYKIESSFKVSISTQKIKGVYYNTKYPNLIYIDKDNGGKSDALNAGVNAAAYPLFVCLDADSRIEKDALLRLGEEFIKNTDTVVTGGIVRIANGSIVENGVWEGFKIPEKMIERFQIVEYFRSFLAGRISWGMTNSLLIVSGAFGVFKKQVVIDVGGYKNDTVGEDMEIVVRIHKYMMQNKKKYLISFCQDAVCWTQGPRELNDIRGQRRRWQIGLMDTLITHRSMLLNPRYKMVGLFAVPYNWIFELFGAVVEVLGYFVIPFTMLMGQLNAFFFILYWLMATMLGIALSIGGLILEQYMKKGCMNAKQGMQMSKYAILENFGYRQLITIFRVEGMLKYRKLRSTWGDIKRREFNQ